MIKSNIVEIWKVKQNPESMKGNLVTLPPTLDHLFSRGKNPPETNIFAPETRPSQTHRIHVWYIYLHLAEIYGKCR